MKLEYSNLKKRNGVIKAFLLKCNSLYYRLLIYFFMYYLFIQSFNQ